MSDYVINRQEAAQLIWISLRSIDRYSLSWKLNYKKIKWRVLFKKDDLLGLKNEKNTNIVNDNIDVNFSRYSNKPKENTIEVFSTQDLHNQCNKNNNFDLVDFIKTQTERDMYKELYNNSLIDLQDKQKKLENINFKLWDIISKQNIPLLENKKKEELIKGLNNEVNQKHLLINRLKNELLFQKILKYFFISILIINIIILSFWYFYNFKI